MLGGEQRAIPTLLRNAWLLQTPTCPELDEPVADAKARAKRARDHNIRALFLVYRDQKERGEVNPDVLRFFSEQEELRTSSAADPVADSREFLGLSPPKRGAPPRTAARNFFLAADIHELVELHDKTVNAACGMVFERLDTTDKVLGPETLRNIYFHETRGKLNKKAIEAEVFTRAIREWRELHHLAQTDAEEQRATRLEAKIEAWQACFNARTRALDQ
jgi:hypothetical protein